jgi:Uma2 family endonuclease
MSTPIREKTEHTNGSARHDDFVSLDGLLTVDDWAALPDTKPRYELIDGKLVQKMTTTRRHTKAAGKFLRICDEWSDESGWQFFPEGTGVTITRRSGYVPDVVGFKPNAILDPDASYSDAPFLVAEVLSPGTAEKDRTLKLRDYARAGVPMYLLIDPSAHTLEVYRLQDDTYGAPEVLRENDVWQPDELPGLRVELARLWMK